MGLLWEKFEKKIIISIENHKMSPIISENGEILCFSIYLIILFSNFSHSNPIFVFAYYIEGKLNYIQSNFGGIVKIFQPCTQFYGKNAAKITRFG